MTSSSLPGGVPPLDGGDVGRGRQVREHGVQQRLHTLVLVRGPPHQHRGHLRGEHRGADAVLDLIDGDLFALEELLGEVVIEVGQRLEQVLVTLLGGFLQLGGGISSIS